MSNAPTVCGLSNPKPSLMHVSACEFVPTYTRFTNKRKMTLPFKLPLLITDNNLTGIIHYKEA